MKTVLSIPATISAIFKAKKLIRQIRPDIIVSFGGYVSVPVVIAAHFSHVPSITHEQTLTNSLSTKINSRFVNKVALSFDNPSQVRQFPASKVVVTGNLLRHEIFNANSSKFNSLNSKKPLLYITGGNQGSQFLNQLVKNILPQIHSDFSIIHQTGVNFPADLAKSLTEKFPDYHHFEFIEIEDIGWVLNHAQIVISRAGANTCQELDVLNKNSIIIPLPFTQQNEQILNAKWLQHRHHESVLVLNQDQADPNTIVAKLTRLSLLKNSTPTISSLDNSPLVELINDLV